MQCQVLNFSTILYEWSHFIDERKDFEIRDFEREKWYKRREICVRLCTSAKRKGCKKCRGWRRRRWNLLNAQSSLLITQSPDSNFPQSKPKLPSRIQHFKIQSILREAINVSKEEELFVGYIIVKVGVEMPIQI